MNRKKIEKQIQDNINVTPDFSKIKSEINFDKYCKESFKVKEEPKVSFKFNYWKLATPLAMVAALLVIFLQKGPNPSMQKPNNPSQENSMIVSSSPINDSTIVSDNDAMTSAPEMSKPTSSSSQVSSNGSVSDESPEEGETPEEPQGPTTPGEGEQVYLENYGNFYFEQSFDDETESINEVCFIRYAFDLETTYDIDGYVKVRAFIGVNLVNSEIISLSFEMNGETIYSIENIDETYTFSFFKDELYKSYISLVKYVEFDIKLANLINTQGTLDLNVKSLNNDYIDINKDVIYYFISDNKVVLY